MPKLNSLKELAPDRGDLNNLNSMKSTAEPPTVKNVKKVLLYTYMRGGSSILGEIFHKNKEALYWYEPLDGFYQSSFVLRSMIKPLNILYYNNLTKRVVTEEEAEAVAQFHKNLFSCSYTNVFMSGLLTDSHNHKSSMNFKTCGMTEGKLAACQNMLKEQCLSRNPSRTNPKSVNVEHSMRNDCFKWVWNSEKERVNFNTNNNSTQLFVKYLQCQDNIISYFTKNCQSKSPIDTCKSKTLQVLKEIRMTMELVEKSMDMIPDMYLLYYYRDPRAILASRLGNMSNQGPGGLLTFHIYTEAKLLCHRMASDLTIFSLLEEKYPRRILQLRFEDFALKPVEYASKVYEFLGEDFPVYVIDWLKRATSNSSRGQNLRFGTMRSDSSKVINSWRKKLMPEVIEVLTKTCFNVLLDFKYEL